jgi:hypothetical protein
VITDGVRPPLDAWRSLAGALDLSR